MIVLKRLTLPAILITILAIAACSKKDADVDIDENSDPDIDYFKGWSRSTEDPEGTKFVLPEGIELIEAIHFSTEKDEKCYLKDPWSEKASGNGELVTLCVSFYNKTNKPINLVIPRGLIFISRMKSVQNGILAERVSYEIPPNTVDYHQFNLQCMNGERLPSNHGSNWDIGPITNVEPALELFKFIETKDLYKDKLKGMFVQGAIHDIGNEGKISDYVWSELQKLPNK
ncbi:hypothetical protein [Pedobacter sp. ASV28]|uniref:hypothetical protein n=1 Tax=Pedobacter sp. ASV28 TaxID=2795123 RepID=UPI0018EB5288|nr:hypothetical protein [Pedobacter sp. ASV28]